MRLLDVRDAFLAQPRMTDMICIDGIHPNENTATVWLQGDDLVELLRENGCEVEIVEI